MSAKPKSRIEPEPLPPDPWRKFREAVEVLANLHGLAAPAEPTTDLLTLESVWTLLGVQIGEDPPRDAASRWRSKIRENAEAVHDVILATVQRLDAAIGDALDRTGSTSKFIRAADMSVTLFDSGARRLVDSSPILLAAGIVDSLPLKHPLRDLLPAEEWYRLDGRTPCFVLGPCEPRPIVGPAVARRWYPSEMAVKLTRQFRSVQVAKEAEAAADRRREEEAERTRWHHQTEIGKLHNRMRELERLRAEGKIPADAPPPVPAVRGHGSTLR